MACKQRQTSHNHREPSDPSNPSNHSAHEELTFLLVPLLTLLLLRRHELTHRTFHLKRQTAQGQTRVNLGSGSGST